MSHDFAKLTAYLERLVVRNLPGAELVVDQVSQSVEDKGTGVGITATIFERKRIGGVVQMPGWSVWKECHVPGNMWEPEWVDVVEVGEFATVHEACLAFCKEVFAVRITCQHDLEGEEQLANFFQE